MRQKKLDATTALAKEKDARAAFCHWWIPPGFYPILFTAGSDFSGFGQFVIGGVQDGSAFSPWLGP
jgi:hypothetical protein